MSEVIRLAPLSEIREGKGYSFTVGLDEIAIFLVNGAYYAVSNVCPHQHVPLIAEGELSGLVVTCPMHGWSYNIETGKAVQAAGSIPTYETFIENGYLFVRYIKDERQLW